MAEQFMRIGARTDDAKGKPLRTDSNGNLGTHLNSRNELITHATATVPTKGTKSVILRYSQLKNYSAIVVSVALPSSAKMKITLNWYIQKSGETNGTQVSSEILLETTTIQTFSTGYLEIKGTQISVILANGNDTDIDGTVFIMGIR